MARGEDSAASSGLSSSSASESVSYCREDADLYKKQNSDEFLRQRRKLRVVILVCLRVRLVLQRGC